jgi:hypothetical protein
MNNVELPEPGDLVKKFRSHLGLFHDPSSPSSFLFMLLDFLRSNVGRSDHLKGTFLPLCTMDSKHEKVGLSSKLDHGKDPKSKRSMVNEGSSGTSAPRASAKSTSVATSAVVRDGKMINIRVTLGYLRGIILKKSKRGGKKKGHFDQGIMSAFAELEPDVHHSEYSFAVSRPMSFTSDVATAVWPYTTKEGEAGGTPASSKTKRRLYFSTLLKKDEHVEVAEEESVVESDCEDENQHAYSPEVVNIRLGLIDKGLKIPIGIATLVLSGREIRSRRIELAVRAPTYADKFNGDAPVRRGLFRKRTKQNQKFGLKPNAVLHLRLDVKNSVYSLSGPSLWGDLDGDDDSFGPNIPSQISMMALKDLKQRDVAAHEEHEAIEVLKDLSGTTIFASLQKKSDSPATGDATDDASISGSIAPVVKMPQKKNCEEEVKPVAAAAGGGGGCAGPDCESGAEAGVVEAPCLSKAETKQAKKEILDGEEPHEEGSTRTPSTAKSSKEEGSCSNTPSHKARTKSGTELDMLLIRVDESSLSAGSSSYSASQSLVTDGSSFSRTTISGSASEVW